MLAMQRVPSGCAQVRRAPHINATTPRPTAVYTGLSRSSSPDAVQPVNAPRISVVAAASKGFGVKPKGFGASSKPSGTQLGDSDPCPCGSGQAYQVSHVRSHVNMQFS